MSRHATDRQTSHDKMAAYSSTFSRTRQTTTTMYSKMLFFALTYLLVLVRIQPAAAASVSFENCLSSDYRNNKDPVLLQWVPLHVDASFDTESPDHRLLVTVYGNVTGSRTTATLPAWNDSTAWNDPKFTDGKILREPQPSSANPKLTTLHSNVEVLTYEPWFNDTDFCLQALTNASCPLGPVFNTSEVPLTNLPSFNISSNFNSSYSFASFSAKFLVRYGDDAVTTIGCVSATVTPDMGGLAELIRFLPLMVLLAVGFATIFAGIYSPWGTTDIFHWSSNYGRDPDLLRLVTPGFGDCLQYIQFVVLTGGLTLNYPGFFQPIVSQASWSTLLFNHSFVSHNGTGAMPRVVDGIYYTNGTYGLHKLSQLVGMSKTADIWPGMMVWLLVVVAAILVLFQMWFAGQWMYRFVRSIPEEDLRSKNGPFSVGNVIRIVFNFFLLPLVALTTFQFVAAPHTPAYTTALAAVTLFLILGFAAWLLYLIITTRPRAVLFDDLPTLLQYGPLYNTYSDEAAAYALTPVLLTLIRGIAIGAVQPAGIAQIVLLAICEVVQILTLHAFHPFQSQSSMNAYHTLFAALRFVTIILMIAFIPALSVDEAQKGWIGYAILVIHAAVLILGFFLNAIQTLLEVIARMAGAGGDDTRGQTRGGLSKIFGMRQLSRRVPRRAAGAGSRQSQLSSSAMLDTEEAAKNGYVMPGGRVRSESAGSIGVLMGKGGQRSSSALDNLSLDVSGTGVGIMPSRNFDSGDGSFTPTTAGEMSNYSFLPSPNANSRAAAAAAVAGGAGVTAAAGGAGGPTVEAIDPYYRPPRRARRTTMDREAPSPAERTRGSWNSGDWPQRGSIGGAGGGGGGGGGGRGSVSGGVPVSGIPVSGGPVSSGPVSGPLNPPTAVATGPLADRGVYSAVDMNAGPPPGIALGDPSDLENQLSRGATPAPYMQPMINPSSRTDYSTREVDFYYGVRGQRLNSDAPNRKLGTGPADPTGPMASAAGWFRTFLGGKSKDKGKGFEVLRSSRMPPAMLARAGESDDDGPPPGVPVAMDVIRNGPIESDDEDDNLRSRRQQQYASQTQNQNQNQNQTQNQNPAQIHQHRHSRSASHTYPPQPGETELLDEDGNPGADVSDVTTDVADVADVSEDQSYVQVDDEPPYLPSIDAGDSIHMPSRLPSSRLPSRTQSKASRYGAIGTATTSDNASDVLGAGIPPVPETTTLSGLSGLAGLSVPNVPRKSSRRSGSHLQSGGQTPSLPPPTEDDMTVSSFNEPVRYLTPPEFITTSAAAAAAGNSSILSTTSSRLPFERSVSPHDRRVSEEGSSTDAVTAEEYSQMDLDDEPFSARSHDERPTSFGYVQQGSISRIDTNQRQDLLYSSAEVVDDRDHPYRHHR